MENENMLRLKESINNNRTQKNHAVTVLSKEIKDMKKENFEKDTKYKNQL